MKVVVTGGAGFIGSAFINYLLDNFECDVLCVDKMTYAGRKENIKHDVSFLHKDICDVTEDELGNFDYIVHFAAESHVDNSISKLFEDWTQQTQAVRNLTQFWGLFLKCPHS